jgi:hypothetical protein
MPARPDLNALKRQRHLETDVYRAYAQEPASMTYWDGTATQGLFGVPMSKGSQRLPRRKFGNLLNRYHRPAHWPPCGTGSICQSPAHRRE